MSYSIKARYTTAGQTVVLQNLEASYAVELGTDQINVKGDYVFPSWKVLLIKLTICMECM